MKKTILKKVLPLVAVALVGVAMATSCEKEKNGSSDGQGTNPPVVQTDTTIIQIDTTATNINLTLTPDSIRRLLIGSWREKGFSLYPYNYSDDNIWDTMTFRVQDTVLTVLDKTGIYTNCTLRVLNSNTLAFYKDTSIFTHPFEFSLSLDARTNEYEIVFYNFINLNISLDVKNIPYRKIK